MNRRSVLVVDDDEMIRESLALALEAAGYEVFAAADGLAGLEQLGRMPRPCVILLDLMMPRMNGWDFLQALRGRNSLSAIPVVAVVTAAGARAAGMEIEVLRKPISLGALLGAVRRYCGRTDTETTGA